MEYDKTLNLPKTEFPMRGGLPKKEPEILEEWEKIDIYGLVQEKNKGHEKFILHDGPPYANADIHLGTTLNKILKDIVVKYKSMRGYDAPFVPGWDTHGLPIAQRVSNDWKVNRHEVGIPAFREKCKEYALNFVDIQRTSFKRLGVRGDFEHPYITLDSDYEGVQIKVFGDMVEKGFIYKGLKPVYWCHDCETALAEAEVEYDEKRSPSIYVRFKIKDSRGLIKGDQAYFVIWTTTPWTLPANVAISVNPKYDYVLIEDNDVQYVLAKELVESTFKDLEREPGKVLATFKGSDLELMVCENPLNQRDSLVILGEHVTLEAGTGNVHTAPGHGLDDFEAARKYELPVLSIVDHQGNFNQDAGKYAGKNAVESNKDITMDLEATGDLLKLTFIKHQYPHCWRCHSPLMFRATEQWFASIKGFREEALKAITEDVQWIPSWGRDRIYNMVADRSDWCISRQREWGVPIPIFYCEKCEEPVLDKKVIYRIGDLVSEKGSNIWFSEPAEKLLPEGYTCSCGHQHFRKETDIMDVWFDSGVSSQAVLKKRSELAYPADLYLEGSDQYRGWFNSSLSIAVALTGKAPYKAVLTHGYVVDGKGRKMSKSMGNGVDPKKVIKQLGADILRLWTASADYRKDISASDEILKQVTETYRKLRNTLRFLHSNLYDYNREERVDYEALSSLDQYILMRLNDTVKRSTEYYDNYEFYQALHTISHFCVVDLSAFYLDVIKDRMYASAPDDIKRRSAQQVMDEILRKLITLLTPVLSFTMEEIWSYCGEENNFVSPQLLDWPSVEPEYENQEVLVKWERLLGIREVVLRHLELGRKENLFGNSLGAKLILKTADGDLYGFLKDNEKIILDMTIVSRLEIKQCSEETTNIEQVGEQRFTLDVEAISGDKCERCWMLSEGIGDSKDHPALCPRCVAVVETLK